MSIASKGKPKSDAHRLSMSLARKAHPTRYWLGKKRPDFAGKNNPRWNPNRTALLEKHRLRGTVEWKEWRASVFVRDNFTCQECYASHTYLEPHHIIPIRINPALMFELTNGITLCRPCHQKTIWKESDFEDKYSLLVAA